MLKPIDNILFATDLTPGCQKAYEFAVAMAIRNKSALYILYIIQDMPESVEGRLKTLLGRHQWQELMNTKKEDIRQSMTGKRTSSSVLSDIQDFCDKIGMDGDACSFHTREIIISAGGIADTIATNVEEHKCDIVIMGAHEGIISGNSIGDNIKSVLKNSPVPVTLVPAAGK